MVKVPNNRLMRDFAVTTVQSEFIQRRDGGCLSLKLERGNLGLTKFELRIDIRANIGLKCFHNTLYILEIISFQNSS